ncbi:hypothetical protein LSTR_LSTR005239 [Laodelphax striatellus]|uniref:Homeobox domain-containing protein n=1 Tax=Laodelphax striatellus TaxID=195883 RepID=A0A482XCS3_LAOST|nr:hypothetical protein LSTR_LSTR005239 [Laodelphax striatellus]
MNEDSRLVTMKPRPSSHREFFARIYGHLEDNKDNKNEDDSETKNKTLRNNINTTVTTNEELKCSDRKKNINIKQPVPLKFVPNHIPYARRSDLRLGLCNEQNFVNSSLASLSDSNYSETLSSRGLLSENETAREGRVIGQELSQKIGNGYLEHYRASNFEVTDKRKPGTTSSIGNRGMIESKIIDEKSENKNMEQSSETNLPVQNESRLYLEESLGKKTPTNLSTRCEDVTREEGMGDGGKEEEEIEEEISVDSRSTSSRMLEDEEEPDLGSVGDNVTLKHSSSVLESNYHPDSSRLQSRLLSMTSHAPGRTLFPPGQAPGVSPFQQRLGDVRHPLFLKTFLSPSATDAHFPAGFTAFLARRRRKEGRPRRQRTTFSSEQTLRLELEFHRSEYISRSRRNLAFAGGFVPSLPPPSYPGHQHGLMTSSAPNLGNFCSLCFYKDPAYKTSGDICLHHEKNAAVEPELGQKTPIMQFEKESNS